MGDKIYFFYNGELLCACDPDFIECTEFYNLMESDPAVAQGVLDYLNSFGDPIYPISDTNWKTAETDITNVDIWDLYCTFMQWIDYEYNDWGDIYIDSIPGCEIFSEAASDMVMGTTTIVASWTDDEMPYGFESRDLSQYGAEDWAYYIANKEHYDEDMYHELLSDINNLRADEWIRDGCFEHLSKKALEAFKQFIKFHEDDEDIDACDSIEGGIKAKTRYFANMVSASMSYDGDKYYVAGYYDNLMRGLGDDLSTDSFDAVLEFANELANDGYFIKIKNVETGSEVHYDANVWLDAIENGDVPEDVYEVTM